MKEKIKEINESTFVVILKSFILATIIFAVLFGAFLGIACACGAEITYNNTTDNANRQIVQSGSQQVVQQSVNRIILG